MVGAPRIKAANRGAAVIADHINGSVNNETVFQSNCIVYQTVLKCGHTSERQGSENQQLCCNNNDGSDIRNIVNEPTLRLVSRSMWQARPPKSELDDLELPSLRVIIAHTDTESSVNQLTCMAKVRDIQTHHMKEWSDIGYNFLVGGDGFVYEGRGWNKEGVHTVDQNRKISYNKRSICIAFIGKFEDVAPAEQQLIAAQALINQGVQLKKLKSDYQLYGQRQLKATESPGLALYNIITTWRGWTKDTPMP